MYKFFHAVTMTLALMFTHSAFAENQQCPGQFAGGISPVLMNTAMQSKTRQLCYAGFAILHSGVTRTPLWSAEYLTRERLEQAKGQNRKNSFHAESRLPEDERAKLSDYEHSCFDRGHMANSGDAPDPESQHETFSLANMVPQDPENNERLWEGIESSTRKLTMERGALYVVTGPMYLSPKVERLNGRVMVPTHLYKAIYDPQSGQAAAYIAANSPHYTYDVVSIAELEQRAGINIFPSIPSSAKQNKMALPQPKKPHFNVRNLPPDCARGPDGMRLSEAEPTVKEGGAEKKLESHVAGKAAVGVLKGLLHLGR